ncbi:MAG: TolC family protein [Labilithrix sp.]|nr:TolC family protein [Labilithrix sp.]
MTLSRAIEAGARRGPAVLESLRGRDAATAFARDPGSPLPAPPQVTVLAGARKPYNLPTGPEVAVTVQQELATRGLGAARRRAADWAARAATSDVERARLEGAATAALAWIDLLEAEGLIRVRAATSDDAAKLAAIAEARVTSGVATAVERALARAEIGASRLALLDGEGRETEARLALAHATGTPPTERLVAEGSLASAPEDGAEPGAVLGGVASHPSVRAAEARAAQAEADGSVTRALLGPTLSVGGTVWREGSGDHAAAALVTLPLPFFDASRHDVGRQATIAAAASGHAARLRAELAHEASLAIHEREHTREVREALHDGVVEPLRSALATAMTAYSAGTSELAVVLVARRSALAAEERFVTATADVWRADVRVGALAGTLTRGVIR